MRLKQSIEVMGVSVAVESSHKDPSYAMKVAKYVELVARPIEASLPGVSRERLAIMTALELADQVVRIAAGEKKALKTAEAAIERLSE